MAWRDQVWCTALRPGCTPQICQISDNFSQARSGERVTGAALCTCTSIIYYVLFQITLEFSQARSGERVTTKHYVLALYFI